jgi:PleD family two-component response regulator
MVAQRLLKSFNSRSASSNSLSIGLAKLEDSYQTLEENIENLIRIADQALYHAKANGGDQVCDERGQIASPSLSIVKPDLQSD